MHASGACAFACAHLRMCAQAPVLASCEAWCAAIACAVHVGAWVVKARARSGRCCGIGTELLQQCTKQVEADSHIEEVCPSPRCTHLFNRLVISLGIGIRVCSLDFRGQGVPAGAALRASHARTSHVRMLSTWPHYVPRARSIGASVSPNQAA